MIKCACHNKKIKKRLRMIFNIQRTSVFVRSNSLNSSCDLSENNVQFGHPAPLTFFIFSLFINVPMQVYISSTTFVTFDFFRETGNDVLFIRIFASQEK